jgi:hypothetical protein
MVTSLYKFGFIRLFLDTETNKKREESIKILNWLFKQSLKLT